MRTGGLSIYGALALLGACFLAAPALAASRLEPGVHLDPGTPAERQYVLTLDQARQTGTPSRPSRQNSSPTLFGGGITPPPNAGSSSSRGGASPHRTAGSSSARPIRPVRGRRTTAARRVANRAPTPAPLPAAVL